MSVEIAPLVGRKGLARFVDLPWEIHPGRHPVWVPPVKAAVRDVLDATRNPFYRHAEVALFHALRDGRPAGRLAAIENRAHNAFHGDRVGFFGFFESVDDRRVADALLRAGARWLGLRGLRVMRGPVNPSTNHECGLLVEGFEHPPVFMTPWHPPYYAGLLEGAGFVKARDLLAFHFPVAETLDGLRERFGALARRARERSGVVFRDLDVSRFSQEMEEARRIYNRAWRNNWGFVPVGRQEWEHLTRRLRPLMVPEYAFVAEVEGRAVGFMFNVPDYNRVAGKLSRGRLLPFGFMRLLMARRRIRWARVMVMGILEEHRTRGIYPLLVLEALRRGHEGGVTDAEASWVLEDNGPMNRALRATANADPYRRWRIYDRPVD